LAFPGHYITIAQPGDGPEDGYEKDDSWVCPDLFDDDIGTHEHAEDWNGDGDDSISGWDRTAMEMDMTARKPGLMSSIKEYVTTTASTRRNSEEYYHAFYGAKTLSETPRNRSPVSLAGWLSLTDRPVDLDLDDLILRSYGKKPSHTHPRLLDGQHW
jgi:hypothetical protein